MNRKATSKGPKKSGVSVTSKRMGSRKKSSSSLVSTSTKLPRQVHICIKGKCKYGQACYRKCVEHLRRFGHTPQVLPQLMTQWQHNTDADNLVQADKGGDQFHYRLTNIILMCILLKIIPDREIHEFFWDIMEELSELSEEDRTIINDFFVNQYQMITTFHKSFVSLLPTVSKSSIHNSIVNANTMDELRIYRGFKRNYGPLLEYYSGITRDTKIKTPLYLSTTLSVNTALNFINFDKPVLWEIVVPKDKIGKLPYMFFQKNQQPIFIDDEYSEYEVLLPVGTHLKYLGTTNSTGVTYQRPNLNKTMTTMTIDKPVVLHQFEFLGIDTKYFDRLYTKAKFDRFIGKVVDMVSSEEAAAGKSKKKSKKRRNKKKSN